MAKLTFQSTSPKSPDVLVVPVKDDKKKAVALAGDDALWAAVAKLGKDGRFSPKVGATHLINPVEGQKVLLVGLGDGKPNRERSPAEQARRIGGSVVGAVKDIGGAVVLDPGPVAEVLGLSPAQAVEALAVGATLGNYSFDTFKKKDDGKDKKEKKVTLHLPGKGAQAAITRAGKITGAVVDCRNLQATPGNIATPVYLAKQARAVAKAKNVTCKVYGEAELKKKKYVGHLAVGGGSDNESQMIVLDYNPPDAKGTVGLVGKAITFDTGGISLKPGAKMHEMKYDKSGGCVVLNTIAAAAALGVKQRIVGIITAAENMPGSKATRPGDIITYKNGKSVEILNTDAEGRLVLADGLIEIGTYKPDVIIDFATLTGAAVMTLSHFCAALMSNTPSLADALQSAGHDTGERLVTLPLLEEYGETLKGEHADLSNISKGYGGGTITAGWFLKNFVPEGIPWAHIDIAGTAWGDFKNSYMPNGPSGFGIRLVLDFIEQNGKKLSSFKKDMG